MVRQLVQVLLCLSLILVSGPLAPCKLEHALSKLSAPCSLKMSSRAAVGATALIWGAGPEEDDDCTCDGSCWCSIHLSAPDAGGAAADVQVVIAVLTPAQIDLKSVLAKAFRPGSDAREPPSSSSARSLPLLI